MKPVEQARRRAPTSKEMRGCALMALLLYCLPADASAGDSPQSPEPRRNTQVPIPMRAQIAAPSYPAPFAFVAPHAEAQAFAPTEFRTRRPGLLEASAAADQAFAFEAPILRDTSIARGLSEAKTQDRVRLLTLWQNRASSLSLQAGKRGAPSLQWSTPWMHRDATSRGLFDRWLTVSPRSFVNAARSGSPYPSGVTAPVKTLNSGAPINSK
jgi:hypothetical protein